MSRHSENQRYRECSRSGKLQKSRSTATTLKFESANKTYHLTELALPGGDGAWQ